MKKLSIIIPVIDLKEITQVCLDSLKLYTSNYELIVIDNGSKEETQKYLQELKNENLIDVLIRNEKTVGFSTAMNQGDEKATGEFIVYSNNDVVFTPYWADRMIAHFNRDIKLGLLGITTNRVEGYQHSDYNVKGQNYVYADILTGICLMLRKKISEKLKEQDGYVFDTRYDPGGQEDADLSIRIKKLNFQNAIARDVFIYHFGSASFRELFNHDAKYSHQYSKSRVDLLRKKYKNNNNMETQKSIKAQVDNTTDKPLIMIVVPSVNSEIRVELTNQLIHWSHSDRFRIRIKFITGTLPLDNARSQAVNEFMEVSNSPEDRLFFIDSDIIPPLEALDKLYDANKDIIGALCFMMKPDDKGMMVPVPVALKYDENKKYIVHFDGEGITEIDAYGLAACMIKRKVFETITERIFKFEYYPDGTLKLVGDFYACQIFQKFGFKVYCDFSTVCEHIKPIGLKSINNLMIQVQSKQ